VRRTMEAHLNPASRDFNLDQLRGKEVGADTVASLVQTPPMMAEWRVLVIRDAQGLSNPARTAVLEATSSCPPGLALIVSAEIPSKSKAKFYRELTRAALDVEFGAVRAGDAPGWVMERARTEHGKSIEAAAARQLVAGVGTDLGTLDAELAKLSGYVADRGEIGMEDVREAGVAVAREDRWEWFDLVGERRFAEARARLDGLLASGESGVAIVAGLGTHLIRIGIASAGGQSALSRVLPRYQQWVSKRLLAQSRGWRPEQVERAVAALLRADHLLKSAPLSDRQVVEELLFRLEVDPAPAQERAA